MRYVTRRHNAGTIQLECRRMPCHKLAEHSRGSLPQREVLDSEKPRCLSLAGRPRYNRRADLLFNVFDERICSCEKFMK